MIQDVVREPFVPLTKEEAADIARALSNSNRYTLMLSFIFPVKANCWRCNLVGLCFYRRKVFVNHENSNIQITGELLQCLRPGEWLNDEVIFWILFAQFASSKELVRFCNVQFLFFRLLICILSC